MTQGDRRVRCKQCEIVTWAPPELQQPGGRFSCPLCQATLFLPPAQPGPSELERLDETDSHPTMRNVDPATGQDQDAAPPPAPTLRLAPEELSSALRRDPTVGGERSPLLGQTVLGCRIEAVQAHLPIGTAFRARHIKLDRPVTVKVLSPHLSSDQTTVDRFLNEGRITGRLEHANLVALHDVGRDRELKVYALVLEHIEGCTLGQRVAQSGHPLDPRETVQLMIQASEGLAAAHAAGVIHRDIGPDNLLLASDGLLKVTGFGLAHDRSSQRMTEQGQVVGTPEFMSPEQCQSLEVDERSDVYSLGLVGYYLMTGAQPMLGNSVVATMFNQVHTTPEPPHLVRSGIDPAISRVICRMIEKDPAHRPRTAAAATAELRGALGAEQNSSARRTALPKSAGLRPSSRRQAAVVASDTPTAALPIEDSQRDTARLPDGPRQAARQGSSERLHRVLSSQRLQAVSGSPRWPKALALLLVSCAVLAAITAGLKWRARPPVPSASSPSDSPKPNDPAGRPVAGGIQQQYQDALREGDQTRALKLLTDYLANHATDWKMRRERMVLAGRLKQNAIATADLETLASVGMTTEAETAKLLKIYNEQGEHAKAQALIEQVAGRKPDHVRPLAMLRVDHLEAQKEHALAIALLDRLLRVKVDIVLLKRLALLQIAAGKGVDAARTMLRIPAGLDIPQPAPNAQILQAMRPLLVAELGPLLASSQLPTGERTLLLALGERDPGFYLYAVAKAEALHDKGRTVEAQRELTVATGAAAGKPGAAMLKAIALLAVKLGDPDNAVRALRALPAGEQPPAALLQPLRGEMARISGTRINPARWKRLAELSRFDPTFYVYRIAAGQQRLDAGDPRGALSHCDEALKAIPKEAPAIWRFRARLYRARAQLRLEQYRDALLEARWCVDQPLFGLDNLYALLELRLDAQLGLKQADRARRTLTLLGSLFKFPADARKQALRKLSGSDAPASQRQVSHSYEISLVVTAPLPPLLLAGDLIVSHDGKPALFGSELRVELNKLLQKKRKAPIKLRVTRKGRTVKLQLTREWRRSLQSLPLKAEFRILDKDE